MSADGLGGATIGPREIYDKVASVGEVVIRMEGKLDGHADRLDDLEASHADHEQRLRAIEHTRWPLAPSVLVTGGLALIAILIDVLPKIAK